MFAIVALSALSMQAQKKTVLYTAVGAELTGYDVDTTTAALTKKPSVTLPANIQEAWPSPSHKFLYVAWSNGGASNAPVNGAAPTGNHHGISALRIDPATGALTIQGQPAPLSSRPIFITVDVPGTHVIAAENDPSRLEVYRIQPDGSLGTRVPQAASPDFGIYAHQVRTDPSGKTIILITRGNGPTAAKPEDPGALKIFSYKDGELSNLESVAPNKGFGYQVRHLDFHPTGKWIYVTLERQNQLHVYSRTPDGHIGESPLFVKSTIMKTTKESPGQTAASIHVSPDGKFVYVANRAAEATGENSIAVFAINQQTGEPTLIQSIPTQGFEPRTFSLDASGKILIVANQNGHPGSPAGLSVFKIGDDGKLEFAKKYDIDTAAGRTLFWAGIIAIAN
jgi:6-phosphogluconolactonase (cycloisomerase 2 family)